MTLSTAAELSLPIAFAHYCLQRKKQTAPTTKSGIFFNPDISAKWNPSGYSVIKNPIQAYVTIRASVTMMIVLMFFRGSARGNNPTVVASVRANTAHLLCLASRALLRMFVLRPTN